jgi:hypothetical protein
MTGTVQTPMKHQPSGEAGDPDRSVLASGDHQR